MWHIAFLCYFQDSPLSLDFNSLTMMFPDMDLREFSILEFFDFLGHADECLLPKLRMFCHHLFSSILSDPFCFSSLLGTPILHMLVHLMVSHRFLRLSSFFFIHSFLQNALAYASRVSASSNLLLSFCT